MANQARLSGLSTTRKLRPYPCLIIDATLPSLQTADILRHQTPINEPRRSSSLPVTQLLDKAGLFRRSRLLQRVMIRCPERGLIGLRPGDVVAMGIYTPFGHRIGQKSRFANAGQSWRSHIARRMATRAGCRSLALPPDVQVPDLRPEVVPAIVPREGY